MLAYTDRRYSLKWKKAGELALFCAALLAAPDIASANVFDTDDRRPILPEDQLDFVGVITCNDTGRLPTASLIKLPSHFDGRDFDILLTVAHAFYTKQGRRWQDCRFRTEGRSRSEAKITDLIVGTQTPGNGWNDDWAVARIEKRLSFGNQLPHPAIIRYDDLKAKQDAGGTILLAGHNGEQLPMLYSANCGPRRKTSGHYNLQDNRVFNHDCDMMAGWSGGPLLLRHEGETTLIAINSTEYNSVVHQQGWPYDGRFNPNTAIRINQEILNAISALATQEKPDATNPVISVCSTETGTTC